MDTQDRNDGTRQDRIWLRLWVLGAIGVLVAVAWALSSAETAQAVPAGPGVNVLTQHDGTKFKARQFGDEWYHGYETRDGHTILKRHGWWVYAAKRSDGSLRATDLRVGEGRPTMARHLRDADAVRQADERRSQLTRLTNRTNRESGHAGLTSTGTDPVLVILVQFQNQSNLGTTATNWSNRYFGSGKSVADAYNKNSYNQFTFTPAAESHGTANNGIVGWLTLPINHPDDDGYERPVIRDAIKAADPYVNYASFDTNGDGTLQFHELHVNVVMAGLEESISGNSNPEHSIWANRWYLDAANTPTVDGKTVGNTGFLTFGEKQKVTLNNGTTDTHQATVGVIVHELGHDLGLPDLYDTDKSSAGIGYWGVMGGGSWGQSPSDPATYAGATPVMFDAWSRWTLGWISPEKVTGVKRTYSRSASTGSKFTTAILLGDNPDGPDWGDGSSSGAYYLVENREQTVGSYDESLRGTGMVVLKINESYANNKTNNLVRVIEADGLNDLLNGTNRGDAGDPWSAPQTWHASGSTDRISMSHLTPDSEMITATFTQPPGTAPANDTFAGATPLAGWSQSLNYQSNAFATTSAGEPSQAGCATGDTLWYRYTPPAAGYLDVSLAGSDSPGVVNVWRGTSLPALSAVGCSRGDWANGVAPAVTNAYIPANQTVYVQIGGQQVTGGATWGEYELSITLRPVHDDRLHALAIGTGAYQHNIFTGTATTERPEPENTHCPAMGKTVWYKIQPTFDSTLKASTATSGFDTVLAVWSSGRGGLLPVACNDNAPRTSDGTSSLTGVPLSGGVTYLIQAGGGCTTLLCPKGGALALSATVRPDNDDFLSATGLTGEAGDDTSSTVAATAETGEPNHAGRSSGHSVWWSWTADHDGPVTFDTEGSVNDTVLAAYTGSAVDGLSAVAQNDDATPTVRWSRITFDAVAGQTYRIAVDQYTTAATAGVSLKFRVASDLGTGVSVTDNPGETTFNYDVMVTRQRGEGPEDVLVDVQLPSTVLLVSPPETCTTTDGLLLHCNAGPLGIDETVVHSITVRPTSEGPHAATATLTTPDDEPGHNSATDTASQDFVCDNAFTAAADNVIGTAENEILCGGGGNDVIMGGLGDDLLLGGEGTDTIDYSLAVAGMNVDLHHQDLVLALAEPATAGPADGLDLGTGVERVRGTSYADHITGDDRSNTLDGRGGDDILEGYGRGDKIYGGNGIDALYGGFGADTLWGGKGVDTLDGGPDSDKCGEVGDTITACES